MTYFALSWWIPLLFIAELSDFPEAQDTVAYFHSSCHDHDVKEALVILSKLADKLNTFSRPCSNQVHSDIFGQLKEHISSVIDRHTNVISRNIISILHIEVRQDKQLQSVSNRLNMLEQSNRNTSDINSLLEERIKTKLCNFSVVVDGMSMNESQLDTCASATSSKGPRDDKIELVLSTMEQFAYTANWTI